MTMLFGRHTCYHIELVIITQYTKVTFCHKERIAYFVKRNQKLLNTQSMQLFTMHTLITMRLHNFNSPPTIVEGVFWSTGIQYCSMIYSTTLCVDKQTKC